MRPIRRSYPQFSVICVVLFCGPPLAVFADPSDDFGNATLISQDQFVDTANTATATTSSGDPLISCAFSGPNQHSASVWYRFQLDCRGTVDISTCGSNYDTVLAVYDGNPESSNTEEIACNDDNCGLQSSLKTPLIEPGSLHWIEIAGYEDTGGGTLQFSFEVECCTRRDGPASPPPGEPSTDITINTTMRWNVLDTKTK